MDELAGTKISTIKSTSLQTNSRLDSVATGPSLSYSLPPSMSQAQPSPLPHPQHAHPPIQHPHRFVLSTHLANWSRNDNPFPYGVGKGLERTGNSISSSPIGSSAGVCPRSQAGTRQDSVGPAQPGSRAGRCDGATVCWQLAKDVMRRTNRRSRQGKMGKGEEGRR